MIEDDIDEALHALEFGPTIPDGQGKVARARAALKALRGEVSRLGRQCDDLTAGFVEKQAEITSLRGEVERLRARLIELGSQDLPEFSRY